MNDRRTSPSRLVLPAAALVALLGACGGAPPPGSGSAGSSQSTLLPDGSPRASTIAPPSSDAPPASAATAGIAWATPATAFEPHVPAEGLALLPSGEFLLLGRALTILGASSMAASSTDGSHWTLASPGLEPVANVTVLGAASRSSVGDVAVGTEIDPATAAPDGGIRGSAVGAVYVRGLGAGWTRAATQRSLEGADLHGVLATPSRFVAFGGYVEGVASLGCSTGCLTGVGIWTSGDGRSWEAALRVPARVGSALRLGGIVAGPDGLLAYARAESTGPSTRLWGSPDGSTWTEIDAEGLDGVGMTSVAPSGQGYLGVAAIRGAGPSTFRSTDGIAWSPTHATGPSLDGVTALEEGFVAWSNAANDVDPVVRDAYGVWLSLDGSTWSRASAYEEFYSAGMLALGHQIVSVGSSNAPNPVWVGTVTAGPPS